MTNKKRTTVTTIETHEVWIVRKAMPERHDDSVKPMSETEPQQAIPVMAEDNNTPDKENENTERGKDDEYILENNRRSRFGRQPDRNSHDVR